MVIRNKESHKLCWSRASVTLAGTTGQLSLSIIFPGPTSNPTYLLHCILTIGCSGFFFFQLQFAMSGATLTSVSSLSRGESIPHISALVQCTLQTGFETWWVHYMVNATSSARNQVESSIYPTLHWKSPTPPSHEVWVGVAGSSGFPFIYIYIFFFYQAWPWVTPTCCNFIAMS